MTAEQIRAARAILGIEQVELAKRAGVSVETIKRLEAMTGTLQETKAATVNAIRRALESAGLQFVSGEVVGVSWKWFLERYKAKGNRPERVQYFPDFDAMLSALVKWKKELGTDILRVHAPASATEEQRAAIREAGGVAAF